MENPFSRKRCIFRGVQKVEGKKGKAGYKNCASLSITADDIIKNVYDQNLSWDERQIFKREKKLIDDICQIWKL